MQGLLTMIGISLLWVLAAIAIIHVVMDNRQPVKTMAWVLVIVFLPIAGIIFYLFFGINHRKERLISHRSVDQLTKRSMLEFASHQTPVIPERHKALVDLFINQNLSLPFTYDNIDVLTDGYAFFPRLLHDISQAHHHIHIDMYIIEDDALGRLISDALIAKAREGVLVRVIYDDVGCWNLSRQFIERLRDGGVEMVPFLPVRFPSFTSKANYRNHRKLIVVDGRVGYIGGINFAMRYVRKAWRDTMLRIEGPIVYAMQRTFLIDWYFVDRTLITDRAYYPPSSLTTHPLSLGQIVTSSPTAPFPDIMQGFVRTILAARRYVYIETPYFLPPEPVLFALKTAVVSGVDVRILCPMQSDAHLVQWASRSYLRELYACGAKVSFYRPGFLHSKLMVCDDSLSTCGSTNVDFRSFENNFEVNLFIFDDDFALRLKELFLSDESQSTAANLLPDWQQPRFTHRLWESLTRLISPLF